MGFCNCVELVILKRFMWIFGLDEKELVEKNKFYLYVKGCYD